MVMASRQLAAWAFKSIDSSPSREFNCDINSPSYKYGYSQHKLTLSAALCNVINPLDN